MDELQERKAAMIEQAKTVNAGRKPKFGDRMRNPWAGESNPQRDGIFVSQRRTTGRFNPGLWYEMTDGEGKFWSSNGDSMMFIDHLGEQEPAQCGNCNGSGRMVRDPDIGTGQECFVCDGTGSTHD